MPLKLWPSESLRLDGGLDTMTDPSLLPPNKAQVLDNFSLDQYGSLKKRYGYSSYGTALAAVPTDAFRFILTSGNLTVVRAGTKIYYSTNGTSWTTLTVTGGGDLTLTGTDHYVGFEQYKDKLYIATAHDGLYEWPGTGVAVKVGMARPTASWTVGGTAPSTSNGNAAMSYTNYGFKREYAYAYEVSGDVGNIGPSSGLVTPKSTSIAIWQDSVIDKDLSDPPTPTSGNRYIVNGAGTGPATGAWTGHDRDIAQGTGSGWTFQTPSYSWCVLTTDDSTYWAYGTMWQSTSLRPDVVPGVFAVVVNLPDDSGVSGISARSIYRRIEGGSRWILVARTATTLGATSWTDTLLSNFENLMVSTGGATGHAPDGIDLDATTAPNGQFITRYRDALYMTGEKTKSYSGETDANPNRVYYSFTGEPWSWTGQYLLPTQPTAQTAQALLKDHDRILFFCADSVYAHYGDPPVGAGAAQDFLRPVTETVGTKSPRSVVAVEDLGVLFEGSDGYIKLLVGDNPPVSLSKFIKNSFATGTDKTVAAWSQKYNEVWFATAPPAGGTNSIVLVFNVNLREWSIYKSLRMTQIIPLDGPNDNGDILFLDGTTTIKKFTGAGYLDGSTAIASVYKSPRIPLNAQSARAVIDHIRLDLEGFEGYVSGAIYMDDLAVGSVSLSVGGGRCWYRQYFDQTAVGKNLSLELCHNSNFALTVHGWQVAFFDRPVNEP